jgi:Lar family restriction alleviation protein
MTTDRAAAEPLPCPFCGGPAVVRKSMQEYPAEGEHPAGEYEAWVTIACDTCGIEIGDEYRVEAIAAWNRRSAYPIIAGGGVTVRPLEWKPAPSGSPCRFVASTPLIDYDAFLHRNKTWFLQTHVGRTGSYRSLEAAQAAAQADYEARIRSTLSAPPPQPNELERHQAAWSVWNKLADHGYLSKAAADQGPQGYQASVIDIIKSAAPPPHPEVAGLVEALRDMLMVYDHANPGAFSNGNTDPTGCIDEGEVLTARFVERARAALASMDGGK